MSGDKKKALKRKQPSKIRLIAWALALVVWVGLSLLVSQLVVALIFRWLLSEEQLMLNVTNSIYQAVVYVVCLAMTILLPWKVLKLKTTRDELGLRGLPTWTDILLAPVGLIVVMLVSGLLTAIMMAFMPQIDWEQAQDVGYSNLYVFGDFILAFVCLVILAPLCEEVIFRGWLYGKLRVRLPALPAMILVSVLFGVMHGQWNVGVTVFAMSMGMCLMRELTGTVWSGVILHMLKNCLAFWLLFVA